MKGAFAVAALLALSLTPAFAGSAVGAAAQAQTLKPVFDQYANLVTSMLMQKEKNPENATKLWSNLAGVTGSHIDALAAQDGMHDQLSSWFNFTALTDPPIVQHILDYTQTIGDAVSAWLPDHIGLDKFAANYTQIYAPGITTTETLFSYAPCIISNSPVGAEVAATAINIDPLGVYITPEGANIQPEGFKVLPSIIYIGATGENIQPQGGNIAPALISIAPVRKQVGAAGFLDAPTFISVGVAAAAPDDAGGAGGATSTTPQTQPGGGK